MANTNDYPEIEAAPTPGLAGTGHNGGPDLAGDVPVDFKLWFDHVFRKPDGSCYGTRARQSFVKRYKPPIIALGWSRTIIPSAGNRWVGSLAKSPEVEPPPRRGRGRPRVGA